MFGDGDAGNAWITRNKAEVRHLEISALEREKALFEA